MEKMIAYLRLYILETTAAIIIAFAVMMPVVVGAAGMALDFSQAYLVQQRLAQAIDAAALAAAASSSDPATINQRVQDFFDANYPPEKLGVAFEPVVIVDGDEVTVTGSAEYLTLFLNVIGIDDIDVEAETVVQREVQGLEVVLVLDNTGSMASNNNIGALKTATESFINILFARTANDSYVKVGLVPYSNTVRVGRYGLGQYPDGSDYEGEPFVNLPPDMRYTTDKTSDDWYGCVVEHNPKGYTSAATYMSNTRGQLWYDTGGNPDGHGWDPRDGDNDPYDYDVLDDYQGPWDVYSYGRTIRQGQECDDIGWSNSRCNACNGPGGNCTTPYCFCWHSDRNGGTNRGCPQASIMPLSSNQEDLIDHLDTMNTDGNTLGNIGMAWGYRVLSPEAPFEEANDWDNEFWRKAIILMTDGDNTLNGTYSSYWDRRKNDMTVTQLNRRLEETCEAMKEQGVTVYTITFTSNISNTTKGYYERCASSEDQYYDAPTQEELINVFETISRELSNLHIKS